VLDACSSRPGEQFDPAEFLAESGTLYVVGDDKGVDGPLVAALIENIFAAAKHIANTSPGNRLDPPLLLMLDEAANIAYLPSLTAMVAAGGGRGVTTVNVWQSRAHARDRWGTDAERAIWGASTVKLVLGGLSDAQDLQDLSTLVGTREERTDTVSVNGDGSRSTSSSWREVPDHATGADPHHAQRGRSDGAPRAATRPRGSHPYTKAFLRRAADADRDAITALRGEADPDSGAVHRTATYH
jgi:type IV secretion system protein VirD4